MHYCVAQQLHLSQKNEHLDSHKHLHVNIYSSFLCNSQRLQTTQMSLNGWMVQQTLIHPYYVILFSRKKNELVNKNHFNESTENYTEWNKPILKGYALGFHLYSII